jgi:hypothetical protein
MKENNAEICKNCGDILGNHSYFGRNCPDDKSAGGYSKTFFERADGSALTSADGIVGDLITREKYHFVDPRIVSEVARDALKIVGIK